MHYYLLDPCKLSDSEFEKRQTELLGLAHEFNIRGESGRISPLRSIRDLVMDAESKGARTLVICGDDDTFNQTLGALRGQQFILGFIPLVQNTQLGELLGANNIATGIKTVAARRLALVDTAKLGRLHFFCYLEFGEASRLQEKRGIFDIFKAKAKPIRFKAILNGSYELECLCLGGVVVNAKGWRTNNQDLGQPNDGLLDLVISPYYRGIKGKGQAEGLMKTLLDAKPGTTRIPLKTIEIVEPVGLSLTIASRQVMKIPATVSVEPLFLQLIVGRDRTF